MNTNRIAEIGLLVGEPARAAMLLALMDGRALTADDRVTMQFAEGRVAGVSGCNRYTGPLVLGDENVIGFGLLATTRMACPGEAATIEAAFVQQMGRIDSYRFERGNLVLYARGAEVMRARRE